MSDPNTSAVFDPPSVDVENRADGTLILRSPRQLNAHPHSVLVWLRRWAMERPGQTVLAQRDEQGQWRRVSYREAYAAVRSLSGALRQAGGSQTRPLMILSENSIEQALVTWAAQYAGIPLAPVSPAYSLARGPLTRVKAAADLVKPGLVFVQDGERFARALQAVGLPMSQAIAVQQVPEGAMTFSDYVSLPAPDDCDSVHDAIDRDLPAKYMFTSGSTGLPKAVVITHGMLAAAQEITAQIVRSRPAQTMVQVDWLPWHHVMGGNVVLGRLLRFGGTLYIDEGRPLPGRFEQTLANLREVAPTYYFNVPAGYGMLVSEMERDEAFARHMLRHLEFAYFSGASLPQDIDDRLQTIAQRVAGRRIVVGTAYAATETSAAVMIRTWEAANSSCIGLPLPGCALKLVPDAALPGRYELRVRGPNVFRRYLGQEAKDPGRDDEDFYRVGDAVRFVDPQRPERGLLFAGRFAEDFKLANGTWVRTAALRSKLLEVAAPLLREAVIVGEGRECVTAMCWLDREAARSELDLPRSLEAEALDRHPAVLGALSSRLAKANADTAAASLRIERVVLETEPLSQEAYELTDKGSVNARAVAERRAASVAALYAAPFAPHIIEAAH